MLKQPIILGLLGGLSLFSVYGTTMTWLSGFDAAVEQFQALWYLMVPLAIGFGIQVGLYTKLRQAIQQKAQGALAAGGTSAGVGMLACCVHHTTDVLPIVGLSALASLIGQYQKSILAVSILINIIGIGIMWQHVRKTVLNQQPKIFFSL